MCPNVSMCYQKALKNVLNYLVLSGKMAECRNLNILNMNRVRFANFAQIFNG